MTDKELEHDLQVLHLAANGYQTLTGDAIFRTPEFREQVYPLLKDREKLNGEIEVLKKHIDDLKSWVLLLNEEKEKLKKDSKIEKAVDAFIKTYQGGNV